MRPSHQRRRVLVCLATIWLTSSATVQAQPPDNAALLYYQAFLLYEGSQKSEIEPLGLFRAGKTASNEVVTSYIERNRHVIDLVVTAADIPRCESGVDYSRGTELSSTYLCGIRQMGFLVLTETRWHIEQGAFQKAWDRCMTMRKMALHACDRTVNSYLVAMGIDAQAIGAIREALPLAPRDVNILTQLRANLTRTTALFPSLATYTRQDVQISAVNLTRDKIQTELRQNLESDEYVGCDDDLIERLLQGDEASRQVARYYIARDEAKERLLQGDEAFFQRNRDYIAGVADRLASVIDANLPYAQTCTALDDLIQRLNEEMINDPNASLAAFIGGLGPVTKRSYRIAIQEQARLNAILAAIDVYIALAQTGQLPESLPSVSPPDPFSGLSFDYAKTAEGFTFYCRGQDIPEKEKGGYEFKVNR